MSKVRHVRWMVFCWFCFVCFFFSVRYLFYRESLASGQLKQFDSVFLYFRNELWLSTWILVRNAKEELAGDSETICGWGCSCILKQLCSPSQISTALLFTKEL